MTIELICKRGARWLLVKRFSSGHRAAYVGVPYGHPLYGRDEDWPKVKAIDTAFGHINYADKRVGGWEGHPIDQRIWWFGADNMDHDEPKASMYDTYKVAEQMAEAIGSGIKEEAQYE